MDFLKRFSLLCGLLLLLLLSGGRAFASIQEVRIAVLAHRGADDALERWQLTADYLSRSIPGTQFVIVPVNNSQIDRVVADGEVDFVLTNPASYAGLEHRHGVTRFATLRKGRENGGRTQFGAVILSRADRSDIREIKDLRDKSFMAIHPNAFGGWWMAWKVLRDAGLDPRRDLEDLRFSGFPQDTVVLAVLDGKVDAGTVRAETFASMAAVGAIDPADFRVLNPLEDQGYDLAHSTALYPEWPMAALNTTSRSLVEQVLVALIQMPYRHPAARSADISGWTVPLSYQPVHELMKELRVGAYAVREQVGWLDLFKVFWPWITAGVIVALSLLALSMARMNRQVTKHRNHLHDTLLSIGDAVVTLDEQGMVDFMNGPAKQLAGDLPRAGRQVFDALFHLRDGHTGQRISLSPQQLEQAQAVGWAMHSHAAVLEGDEVDGTDVKLTVTPLHDADGLARGWVVVMHDITQIQELTRQLTHQASHDELTGLVNRREFMHRLQLALEAAKNSNRRHALCFIDLDQFKIVNDTCGHVAGDQLLKRLSALLRSRLRTHDTVARIGGDEFGVLIEDCELDAAVHLAEDLRDTVEGARFEWDGRLFDTGCSIGVVPISARSGSVTDLMSSADTACFAAKDQGRNRVHLYHPNDQMIDSQQHAMNWAQRITQALQDGDLELFVQPIVGLCKRSVYEHYEVLLRMRDKDGQLISPGVFLPAAERFNLMPRLDRWVLEHAIPLINRIRPQRPQIALSINLSGQTLDDPRFTDFVLRLLNDAAVDPGRVCFEITETAAIANLSMALEFIGTMKARGCSFALDDFGSGLSSFRYLKNLPVDFLKIDGAIVRDVADSRIARAMVASIQDVGSAMGIDTIAEFVSSQAIQETLRDIGVAYVQGYAVGRPMPASELLGYAGSASHGAAGTR